MKAKRLGLAMAGAGVVGLVFMGAAEAFPQTDWPNPLTVAALYGMGLWTGWGRLE